MTLHGLQQFAQPLQALRADWWGRVSMTARVLVDLIPQGLGDSTPIRGGHALQRQP